MKVRTVAESATNQRTGRPAAASTAAAPVRRRVGGRGRRACRLVGDADHQWVRTIFSSSKSLAILGQLDALRVEQPARRRPGDGLGELDAIGAQLRARVSANCRDRRRQLQCGGQVLGGDLLALDQQLADLHALGCAPAGNDRRRLTARRRQRVRQVNLLSSGTVP